MANNDMGVVATSSSMSDVASPVVLTMEHRLRAAIKRIRDSKPKDEALVQLSATNKLRVTISNVAREAGCSRTLIGHEGCAYPEVRNEVLKLMAAQKGKTLNEEIGRLREEVAALEGEIEARDSAYAELVIRVAEFQRGRHPSGRPVDPLSGDQRRVRMQLVGKDNKSK